MCRLLGVVSRGPTRLSDSLDGVLGRFTELSCEHADGWGLAAWRDGELTVARHPTPAHAGPYLEEAADSAADAAVLHIRLASPGLAVSPANTHPFTAGTLAFAHNGCFAPVDAVDELIDADLLADAAGDTDSEHFFLRILTRLRYEDPVDAITGAADDIRSRAEVTSLNCLLLTDGALYAYAEADSGSEVSRRRGPDFFRLHYRAEPERVLVASDGIPAHPEEWTVLPDRQVLEIRRTDLRVSTHLVCAAV